MGVLSSVTAYLIGAVVNLDHPTHYVHRGWISISVANLLVIVVMIAVFALAIALPFPKGRRSA